MNCKTWLFKLGLAAMLVWTAAAAPFGRVVPIGGQASDLALDEARGVLYVANFTANRIEVVSLADYSIQRSINVPAQPSSLSISPDGKWLVIAHYGNFATPLPQRNGLTVVNLETDARQSYTLGATPLGVAFGIDNRCFVATSTEFLLFDPVLGTTTLIQTVGDTTGKALPQPPGSSFPPNIVSASLMASRDGLRIFGITDTIRIGYDVTNRRLAASGYVASPQLGPRVVSVNNDGTAFTGGWALWDGNEVLNGRFGLVSQFPNPSGTLEVGSHAYDQSRGLIYTQMPEPGASGVDRPAPVLQVVDSFNLAVYERISLPENLSGKSMLSSDNNTMFAISDSGITVLPVGQLNLAPRVAASQEDVVFRGNFCDRRVNTQEILIVDQAGGSVDFTLSSDLAGVRLSPSTGVTPARVRVSVDPAAFQNINGSSVGTITLRSQAAVNLPKPIRVVVNSREPDQRGSFFNVPGKLIDLVADPSRNRFFILRQDTNEVLVFDGGTYAEVARLKTGNTPTQMAISFDRRWLLVGADNSQYITVFDLETLEASTPVRMPGGHYPRSVASSGRATLAANRVAGTVHTIDTVDLATRTAQELPSLGAFKNDVNISTTLVASTNGGKIFGASADGTVYVYDANQDSFTSRKDQSALTGAYAASNFDQFVVGNFLLNSSGVRVRTLETQTGQSSGFLFLDDQAIRATSPAANAAGVIQRVDLRTGQGVRPTRMIEAPRLPEAQVAGAVFTRTLAPLADRSALIALTVSGFTVLPWNYDVAVAPPRIERVVNAADNTGNLAPGGLVTIFGRELSPVNAASRQIPLPTALGESCLTINGVPVPVMFVSSNQINAQLPTQTVGTTTMILRTPGGVSDNFNLVINPTAPSVFRNQLVGLADPVPAIVRLANGELVTLSNPIKRGDTLTIYLTGMGVTSPAVEAGFPAPSDPPASVVASPTVTLGGVEMVVTFAGLVPGQVGVYQINVNVPGNVPVGFTMPLTITQGSVATTVNVRVVN